MSIAAYLKATLLRGTQHSQLKILLAAWVSLIGHPLYWAIWVYVLPQPHESAVLRFSAALLALGLLLQKKWPENTKHLLPIYWHIFLLMTLPIPFTFLALKNNLNFVWIPCHLGMIFMLSMIVLEIAWFFIIIALGTFIGILLYLLDGGDLSLVSINIEYIPIMLFAIILGAPFMHTALLDIRKKERQAAEARTEGFKALSGNIAHEVRNPVSSAQQAMIYIKNGLDELKTMHASGNDAQFEKKYAALARISDSAMESLKRGDVVIQIILKNIREETIDPAGFSEFSLAETVRKALAEYPFQKQEAEKIVVSLEQDFIVRGDENLVIFTLFNLLKNALYYLPANPDHQISIRLQPGADYNRLLFKDTGPGIAEKILPRLFECFATYEKVGGTGLGLPFCKRVMTAMNGDIHCHSVEGEGAEFTLSFPLAS